MYFSLFVFSPTQSQCFTAVEDTFVSVVFQTSPKLGTPVQISLRVAEHITFLPAKLCRGKNKKL